MTHCWLAWVSKDGAGFRRVEPVSAFRQITVLGSVCSIPYWQRVTFVRQNTWTKTGATGWNSTRWSWGGADDWARVNMRNSKRNIYKTHKLRRSVVRAHSLSCSYCRLRYWDYLFRSFIHSKMILEGWTHLSLCLSFQFAGHASLSRHYSSWVGSIGCKNKQIFKIILFKSKLHCPNSQS